MQPSVALGLLTTARAAQDRCVEAAFQDLRIDNERPTSTKQLQQVSASDACAAPRPPVSARVEKKKKNKKLKMRRGVVALLRC